MAGKTGQINSQSKGKLGTTLIYAGESTCFENKMLASLNELSDKESIKKQMRDFFRHFQQQPEEKCVVTIK